MPSYDDKLFIIESLKLNWNDILKYYDIDTIDCLIKLKYNRINLYRDINWNILLNNSNIDIIKYFLKISYKLYDLKFTINNSDNYIKYFNNSIIENNLKKIKLLNILIPNGICNSYVLENCNNEKILNWFKINMPMSKLSYKTKYNFCFIRYNNIYTESNIKCNCSKCGNGIGWII